MSNAITEAYFHEDDYCQQELLPLTALEFCRQQISEIDEFSNAHKAPDGVGWTDIYRRKDPPKKLVELGVAVSALRKSMIEHLPEITTIYTGYGSHEALCENTIGFGVDTDWIVYAEWNDANVVEAVWTDVLTSHVKSLERFAATLQQLGREYPLLYVDWAWGFATPLDQSSSLRDRLVSKAAELSRQLETTNYRQSPTN